jgi:hypothetical protein
LVYVGFAAVYGVPVILLTGSVRWGLVLCGLGFIRLLSALVFIRQGAPE